jgi:hypothetical protein
MRGWGTKTASSILGYITRSREKVREEERQIETEKKRGEERRGEERMGRKGKGEKRSPISYTAPSSCLQSSVLHQALWFGP